MTIIESKMRMNIRFFCCYKNYPIALALFQPACNNGSLKNNFPYIMWHIIFIGYIFVTLMFSIAQPSLARALIYLVFWTILPTLFAFWVLMTRRRNQRMKHEEQLAQQQSAKNLPKQ